MARNRCRVDLGYEECGFPSHLYYLNEFSGGFNSLSRSHRDPYVSNVVDTLSDQFSSMSLLPTKPRLVPPLTSSLQPLGLMSLSSVNNISSCGPKRDQILHDGRSNVDPFYEFHLSMFNKNESQQESVVVLQRQEDQLRNAGVVHRNGNVKSVGTGVFHPLQRPSPACKTISSVKKRNQRNRNQNEKMKLMTKERREVMGAKQQQQHDECHYHLPWDMDFYKD